jgi:hypothetical protein
MFLGHFGVGFGAKRLAPRTSLGTLFLAAQFLDLLWPTLLLLGLERVAIVPGITVVTPLDFAHYPLSHSLLAAALWGLLFGTIYWLVERYRAGAWICGLAVVSHWLLDLLLHRPDLPLTPGGGYRAGFGLWDSLTATLVVELSVFAAGLALYLRTTSARDRIGAFALWGLVGGLLVIYAANLFGPPPPSTRAIAWVGQAQWLLIAWGYWIDRHRATMLG